MGAYDLYSGDEKQCWQHLNHFELCLELNTSDMRIEIIKSRKIVFPSKHLSFDQNDDWDEITNEQRKGTYIVTKCVHVFEAKLCILRSQETRSDDPFSYI